MPVRHGCSAPLWSRPRIWPKSGSPAGRREGEGVDDEKRVRDPGAMESLLSAVRKLVG